MRTLGGQAMSDTTSLLAAHQSSCAFTTLLQIRSQNDGFFGCLGLENLDMKRTFIRKFWKAAPQISLPPSLTNNGGKKKNWRMTNVRENMNLPKGVQEKKTALSSTVLKSLLGLVFKSHINFVIGKKLRHVGLLRNSNEETVGMVGVRVEERWRLVNSKFSHLFSLCLAQESGLVPGSSPLSPLYTGKAWLPPLVALALLWKAKLNEKSPLCHTWLLAEMSKSAKPLLSQYSNWKILKITSPVKQK